MGVLIIITILLGTALGMFICFLKEYHNFQKVRECYEELITELIEELNEYRESDNY